jgi:hypothetical protein
MTPSQKHELSYLVGIAALTLDYARDGNPEFKSEAEWLAANILSFARKHAAEEPMIAGVLKEHGESVKRLKAKREKKT